MYNALYANQKNIRKNRIFFFFFVKDFVVYYEHQKSLNNEEVREEDPTEATHLLDSSGSSDVVLIQPVNMSWEIITVLFKKVSIFIPFKFFLFLKKNFVS